MGPGRLLHGRGRPRFTYDEDGHAHLGDYLVHVHIMVVLVPERGP